MSRCAERIVNSKYFAECTVYAPGELESSEERPSTFGELYGYMTE